MNSEELINEILNDFPVVLRKAEYLTPKVRRDAIKLRKKNLSRIFEYKSLRKNNWLILIDYNNADPLILPAVYYLCDNRINTVLVNDNIKKMNSITKVLVHYSSHFLERFNERFLKEPNLTKLDILKRFLPQNNVATYDGFADNIEDKHGKTIASFKDGYGLGVYEQYYSNQIIYLKTYVSPDMLFENQKKSYASITQAFRAQWDEFLKIKPELG